MIHALMKYCIQLKFGGLKNLLYKPVGGYLCYFKFVHSSRDTKQDIYLKDVILVLS